MEYTGWLITFVIIVVILGTVLFNFADRVENTGQAGNENTNSMIKFAKNYPSVMDWMPLIVYLVMLIGGISLAKNVVFERGYVVLSFMLIFIMGAVSMFAANFLTYIIEFSEFSTIRPQLIVMPIMAEYYLLFGIVYMLIGFIALLIER